MYRLELPLKLNDQFYCGVCGYLLSGERAKYGAQLWATVASAHAVTQYRTARPVRATRTRRKRTYQIAWDNGHACGTLAETFTNKRTAEQYARGWKREMVALDNDPKEARRIYQWEIVEP